MDNFLLDTPKKMKALESLIIQSQDRQEFRGKINRICEICDKLDSENIGLGDEVRDDLEFRLAYETSTLSEEDRARYLMDWIVSCLESETEEGQPDYEGIYREMSTQYNIIGDYEFSEMSEDEFLAMCRIIFTPFKVLIFSNAVAASKIIKEDYLRWCKYWLDEKFFKQFEHGTFSDAEKTLIFNVGDNPVKQLEKLFSPINLKPVKCGYIYNIKPFDDVQ